LNHSLLLSTYYFFLICCRISNDLKFFKHVANLPWRMNPMNYNHFEYVFIMIRPCEVHLTRFFQELKMAFYHFERWYLAIYMVEISEFFPLLFNLAYYKILWLYVSENNIFQKFGTSTRNGSFWVFWVIT